MLLGPSHTGLGPGISVSSHDSWLTPLGKVPVDRETAKEIVQNSASELDELAHAGEHSLEVQLPLLQYRFREFKIVPITIATGNLGELLELGGALAKTRGEFGIIASGDFSHYVPRKTAEERDGEALKLIEGLKAEEFNSLVRAKNLSICGLAPFTVLLEFCRKTGLKRGKTLEYTTSAETTGDTASVVGYASVIFE